MIKPPVLVRLDFHLYSSLTFLYKAQNVHLCFGWVPNFNANTCSFQAPSPNKIWELFFNSVSYISCLHISGNTVFFVTKQSPHILVCSNLVKRSDNHRRTKKPSWKKVTFAWFKVSLSQRMTNTNFIRKDRKKLTWCRRHFQQNMVSESTRHMRSLH